VITVRRVPLPPPPQPIIIIIIIIIIIDNRSTQSRYND
jgi:hypothetical protein